MSHHTGTELIFTENLIKFFGSIPVLDSLNLTVPTGISGFIGPNGAGKTTTINILLGLLKADSGKAEVFGLDCWTESFQIRRRLGVLHEKPTYPTNFTGKRYLEHVAHLYEVSQPKQRAKETLNEVGLLQAGEKPIKTYSAGMNQRLGLAQALIGNPELVILDEPTANLDPLGRMEFLEKIKQLQKDRGLDIFISSHILPELEKVCDYISIINNGVVLEQGTVAELAIKYSANVYKIVVSNPNLLTSRLQASKTIEKAWIDGDTIYCQVKKLEAFQKEIPKLAFELNLELKSFHPSLGALDEVFKAVVTGDNKQ